MKVELQVAEAAGWRALLTYGQQSARTFLLREAENYLVALLYRRLGSTASNDREQSLRFARQLVNDNRTNSQDLGAVGDHCLLFAGLFPEHAMRQGTPLASFVQVGQQAWRDHAARLSGEDAERYRQLAGEYIRMLDVLLAVRQMNNPGPCIDALNAWQLWQETGSVHGWHVLRQLTPSLPGATPQGCH